MAQIYIKTPKKALLRGFSCENNSTSKYSRSAPTPLLRESGSRMIAEKFEQLSEVLCKHAERENGLQDLVEIMIESMMVAERREYLREDGLPGDKGNGFRMGDTYGQGSTLTFRIPRDRYGNFHPRILAVLRSQEEECERLAGTLYSKGLTQEQAGNILSSPVH